MALSPNELPMATAVRINLALLPTTWMASTAPVTPVTMNANTIGPTARTRRRKKVSSSTVPGPLAYSQKNTSCPGVRSGLRTSATTAAPIKKTPYTPTMATCRRGSITATILSASTIGHQFENQPISDFGGSRMAYLLLVFGFDINKPTDVTEKMIPKTIPQPFFMLESYRKSKTG